MSQGKIWAKIVNDEIMQLHDENPAGLWHPDAIAQNDLPGHWEEVPVECHIGWKRDEDGVWHDGAWWYEKNIADNPTPPPGPPSAGIAVRSSHTPEAVELTFTCAANGVGDLSHVWEVAGETHTTEEVSITVNKVVDTVQKLKVKLTVTGEGGSTVAEETIDIAPWAPPVAVLEI